jgi:predicted metal-dependent hydrolase
MAMSSQPQIRNLRFETGAAVPRHWHGGRRSVTAFFDNLSVFFPVGERFFMKSVRAHERFVHDDALLAAVRLFCGQEGIHGREHERYNEMLAAQGYPVEAMEARVRSLLRFVKRVAPMRLQLAATCALEHFTALMGELLLTDPAILEGADPRWRRCGDGTPPRRTSTRPLRSTSSWRREEPTGSA